MLGSFQFHWRSGEPAWRPVGRVVLAASDPGLQPVLERAIADRGRYPAINILRSISRSMPRCLKPEEAELVKRGRERQFPEFAAYDVRPLLDLVALGTIADLVPFAFDETGLAGRRAQQNSVSWGPGIEFEYVPVSAGPQWYENYHDWILADLAMLECALRIQADGYDAVCIDTMSDSGVNAIRCELDIPVIGPGRASYLTALMLGSRLKNLCRPVCFATLASNAASCRSLALTWSEA